MGQTPNIRKNLNYEIDAVATTALVSHATRPRQEEEDERHAESQHAVSEDPLDGVRPRDHAVDHVWCDSRRMP
eukprot:7377889-Prymnesium_polylepis.1